VRAADPVAPKRAKGQRTLLQLEGVKKFVVPKARLAHASASATSPATYAALEETVALEVVQLPSERRHQAAQRVKLYSCPHCSDVFSAAISLATHMRWRHVSPEADPTRAAQARPQAAAASRRREDELPSSAPAVTSLYRCAAAAAASAREKLVHVDLLIAGRPIAEIRIEAEEAAARAREAEELRQLELQRQASARRRFREHEDFAVEGEQRRGSDRRRSYNVKEKLLIIDFYESVRYDESKTHKVEYFEADKRSRGVRWNMVQRWDRRAIEKAAGQAHAATLLRVDKTSRRVGKFAGMEKSLFALFRLRRARGRKCSARWFVHVAKHLMRKDFPEHAANFSGGRCWLRRFLNRWNISMRRKTNVKNSTWEATKPVLQRYFRSTRRRLRDAAWETAMRLIGARVRARSNGAPMTAEPASTATDVCSQNPTADGRGAGIAAAASSSGPRPQSCGGSRSEITAFFKPASELAAATSASGEREECEDTSDAARQRARAAWNAESASRIQANRQRARPSRRLQRNVNPFEEAELRRIESGCDDAQLGATHDCGEAEVATLASDSIAAVAEGSHSDRAPAPERMHSQQHPACGSANVGEIETARLRAKWGKYLPHQRLNVDQVSAQTRLPCTCA
jgi:hypothetical protein